MFSSPGEKPSDTTDSVFPGSFSKYICIASIHFINIEGCIFVIVINLKTLMASTTPTLTFVGVLFNDFSAEITYKLSRRSDLRLECVFSFLPHIEYLLLFTGQFIIIRRSTILFLKLDNISSYDSFLQSVLLSPPPGCI